MVASLRTGTGCLACRRRHKKCDERKPVCLRCSKSNASCTWPRDDQIDKRRQRRKRHNAGPSAAGPHSGQGSVTSSRQPSHLADDNDCGQVVPREAAISFDSSVLGLPLFIVEYFLPFEFHRPNLVNMADVSYLVSMCCKSSFIRNSVEACAMIALPSHCRMVAQDLYRTAVQEISARIQHGLLGATDDELLAAIVWLCVFENSLFEGGLCTSIHLKALSNLLLLREPMDPDSAAPNALAWERMCVESFVYHSAVTTLFDDEADASITARVLNKYKRCVSPMALNHTLASLNRSVFQSPILGAPCDIFLMLMRATRLVRQADPLSFEDEMVCWNQYSEIRQWQLTLDGACAILADARVWMGKIYAVTTRIMLLHIILSASSTRLIEASRVWEIKSVKSELAQLLGTAERDLDRTWSKFILWPVAIFGAISLLQEETRLTQHLLTIIAKRGHCSTPTLVQKVLEGRVWPRRPMLPERDELSLSMDGLRIILSADIMLEMASALMASTSVITPRAASLIENMP